MQSSQPGSNSERLLQVKDLKVYFSVETGFFAKLFSKASTYVRAVDNVSFGVDKGEIFSLAGESGCGKTTLGMSIMRLVEVTSGKIYFNGTDVLSLNRKNLKKFRRDAQMIFQDPYEALPPHLTVFDIIGESIDVHKLASTYDEKMDLVYKVLEDVRLIPAERFIDAYSHQLSGGQRQRVAIASALVLKPKLIVADEPVSMLDVSVRSEILNLMLELREQFKLTYLFITHDLAVARYLSDRIAIMYLGKIVEMGRTKGIIETPLHPYTKALMSVVPVPDPFIDREKRIILSGEVPSATNIPSGCRFHTRCPLAKENCRKMEPEMVEAEPGHYVACWCI